MWLWSMSRINDAGIIILLQLDFENMKLFTCHLQFWEVPYFVAEIFSSKYSIADGCCSDWSVAQAAIRCVGGTVRPSEEEYCS